MCLFYFFSILPKKLENIKQVLSQMIMLCQRKKITFLKKKWIFGHFCKKILAHFWPFFAFEGPQVPQILIFRKHCSGYHESKVICYHGSVVMSHDITSKPLNPLSSDCFGSIFWLEGQVYIIILCPLMVIYHL